MAMKAAGRQQPERHLVCPSIGQTDQGKGLFAKNFIKRREIGALFNPDIEGASGDGSPGCNPDHDHDQLLRARSCNKSCPGGVCPGGVDRNQTAPAEADSGLSGKISKKPVTGLGFNACPADIGQAGRHRIRGQGLLGGFHGLLAKGVNI